MDGQEDHVTHTYSRPLLVRAEGCRDGDARVPCGGAAWRNERQGGTLDSRHMSKEVTSQALL